MTESKYSKGKYSWFKIQHGGEIDAGIRAYSDRVIVWCESGDWGGDPGEFEEHMRQAIAEWFDGAGVVWCDPDHLEKWEEREIEWGL